MSDYNEKSLVCQMIKRYKREFALYRMQYLTMGRLLDETYVSNFVNNIFQGKGRIYVYGSNYLGMHTYTALRKYSDGINLSVVDYGGGERWGENEVILKDATIISEDEFKEEYNEGVVIISILDKGETIREKIAEIVPINKIYFVNELVRGEGWD